MSDFSLVIDRFRELSRLSLEEDEQITKATHASGPLHVAAPEMRAYCEHPRPHADALEVYVSALEDAEVFALTALMYTGREEEENDPIDYWSALKSSIGSREHAVVSLLEKVCRMEYIDAALAKMSRKYTLNDVPSKISAA